MKGIYEKVERGLIRFIIFMLVLVVVIQGIMTRDPLRFYLSWGERMEGESLAYPVNIGHAPVSVEEATGEPRSSYGRLVFSIDKFSSLPRTKILVNGKEVQSFDSQEVTLNLKGGDVVEIDSRAYDFPVEYRVKSVSTNLTYPEAGASFSVNQGIVMIGKVIVK